MQRLRLVPADVATMAVIVVDDEAAAAVVLLRLEEHILFDNLPSVSDEEHDDEAEMCEALLLFEMDRMTSSKPTLTIVLADEDGQEAIDERFVLVPKGDSDDDEVQYSKLYEAPLLLEEAWDLKLLLLLLCWLLVLLLLRL